MYFRGLFAPPVNLFAWKRQSAVGSVRNDRLLFRNGVGEHDSAAHLDFGVLPLLQAALY